MSGNAAWIVPIVVALIAALGTYLGIVRRASGKIATTEAAKLWDEAGNLREVYRKEIDRLQGKIDEIEGRLTTLEVENSDLREKNLRLEKENVKLHEENATLKHEVQTLKRRVSELENHVAG